MDKQINDSAQEEVSYIFGKKVTGKKAVVAGTVIGVLCGLVVVGLLALILLNL